MTPTAPTGGRGCVRGTLVTADGPVPDGLLAFEGTRITYAGPAAGFTANGWPEPASFSADSLLLPGLVDLHCHGALGCDFTSTADPGLLRRAAGFLHSAGTTTLLASLVSAPPAEMLAAAGRLGALAREGLVSGLHAEGPFLSAARPGAQAPDCLQAPDPDFVDALMEAADNELITMTFAPELPGADELLDRIISRGITPSIGHTDADDAVAAAALESARDEMEEAGFDGYTPPSHGDAPVQRNGAAAPPLPRPGCRVTAGRPPRGSRPGTGCRRNAPGPGHGAHGLRAGRCRQRGPGQ